MKWLDPKDCNKGFEYLYLLKADYEKLPAGTVQAHKVQAGSARLALAPSQFLSIYLPFYLTT